VQSVTDYAIYMLDPSGKITSWNAGAERFKGYTADEIIGEHFSRFYTEEDRAMGVPERALDTARKDGRFEAEGWRARKDGTCFWASVIIDTIRGHDGAILGFAKVTRDLTEKRATEEQLRQAQKMEAVGQLTGGIAHDFNNLLAGISGNLELLDLRLGQGRTVGLDRYLRGAQEGARRAASLTQRLLAFSRRQTLDPKPADVNKLINGMEDLIRRSVGPAIELEVVGSAGLWPACVDQSQLENALLNLSINARDAMPQGGRITIETANKWLDDRVARERDLQPGQYVSICVTDTGSGMTPDVIAQAFDPFFTTKPLGQGTGLGLSMIHGFVRQSGGQVRIYSEVGSGTTMCLYFPRFLGALNAEEVPDEATVIDAGHGETVLVIDDEAPIRLLIVEVLQDAGYKVIEAGDGPAGLKVLQTEVRVDLLITDVGLPGGLNGRQVADAARLTRPDLKILFVTGYAENAAVGNGHLEHGMEVMTKPFSVGALSNKVAEVLDR
jgi:PAS domain S-box-containing protein